uniref:Uncharacterized protein n=1 Tax=Pseudomonas fluorescens (strain SBW25) TaxID=216595 RepID=A0A0G4E5R5_PSEFS|nr:hypothetical protein PQBR57_0410 [Pseudomonas fluorescens SBW25]
MQTALNIARKAPNPPSEGWSDDAKTRQPAHPKARMVNAIDSPPPTGDSWARAKKSDVDSWSVRGLLVLCMRVPG